MTRRGMTLVEIVLSMVILMLIAGGIFNAIVFGRTVAMRFNMEAQVMALTQQITDYLRTLGDYPATPADPYGMDLRPGIHVDPNTQIANAPNPCNKEDNVVPVYQTLVGDGKFVVPEMGAPGTPTRFGLRWWYGVEYDQNANDTNPTDTSIKYKIKVFSPCVGTGGIDTDNDRITDVIKVEVHVRWNNVQG